MNPARGPDLVAHQVQISAHPCSKSSSFFAFKEKLFLYKHPTFFCFLLLRIMPISTGWTFFPWVKIYFELDDFILIICRQFIFHPSTLEQGCSTQKNYELLLAAHEPPFMIYIFCRSLRSLKGNQIRRIKERKKVKKLPSEYFFFQKI